MIQQQFQNNQQIKRDEKEIFEYFICNNLFKRDIGCTYAQFNELYKLCIPIFSSLTCDNKLRKREQRVQSSHSDKFQLLVTLFWLRKYLEEEFIARIFLITQQKVSSFIHRCVDVLYSAIANTFIGLDNKKQLITYANQFASIAKHVPLCRCHC